MNPESNDGATTDRYRSFVGLDCDAKARELVEALREAMGRDDRADPFWDYFQAKLNGTKGPTYDELYHLHCHLNDLRDLLERWDEASLAALLEDLEVNCC
ncbi:N(2)-fixation sustaining protein CowN [uncultured Thiodictyon sp.]|uniref:N(2)-fixation sustaining protein CowN n=1 Tax=uncultured Thiodictyon sp. TaxID=1846217 RepID=UPI0025D82696|nr:N(2)-fixation sustaining protein CowN [uncultured Thiodictyon sp.]